MRLVITISIFILLLFNVESQIFTYKNFNHKSGLILNSTTCILERNDGGLLIGTDGAGIIEFDGYGFKELAYAGQDLDHHVHSILIEGSHILFSSEFKGVYSLSSSGKLDLVFKVKELTGYKSVLKVDKKYFLVHNNGIVSFSKNNQFSRLYTIPKQEGKLHVSNQIEFPGGFILQTNFGNLIYQKSTNKISKLSALINFDSEIVSNSKYGYFKNNHIELYIADFTKKLTFDPTTMLNLGVTDIQNSLNINTSAIVSGIYNPVRCCYSFATENGTIIEEKNNTLSEIPANFEQKIQGAKKIACDTYGDYWLNTDFTGLFKVSKEPFSKLNYHPEFKSNQISFVYKLGSNILISTFNQGTYFGHEFHGQLKSFPINILSGVSHNGKLYCGTKSGVYIFDQESETFTKLTISEKIDSEKIFMLQSDGKSLWIGAGNKGLTKYNTEKRTIVHWWTTESANNPEYCYTAQFSFDYSYLYIGTNRGIFRINTKTLSSTVMNFQDFGHYSGNSVKDVFGTNWFTLDKGIIGITKRGEVVKHSDRKLFPSFLFFTINSDNYGNLILGTNRGLNILKVNDDAKVLSNQSFEGTSGFEGYETNMRACFQLDNDIYVGTAEGLFHLNMRNLQDIGVPISPIISAITPKSPNSSGTYQFKVLSKNPKSREIFYSYKIKELDQAWSEPSTNSVITIGDMSNGTYTLLVKCSYDGYEFSQERSLNFNVDMPIFRSNWFIVTLIILIIGLNIYFLTRSKHLYPSQIFYSEDFFIIQKLAPSLILFGCIANSAAQLIAPYLSDSFPGNSNLTISVGVVLLSIYFIAMVNRNKGNIVPLKRSLAFAFIVIMIHNLYCLYESSLHPFYALAVVLISSIAPFIFERTQSIIIYAVCFIFVNGLLILLIDDLHYDKYLYLIAVLVSAFLGVLMTYIRHDSIHKLVFISSVINKGNIPAIAFDKEGQITYVSRNIHQFLPVDHNELLNQNISSLNKLIPDNYFDRSIDLSTEFENDHNYVIPMHKTSEDIIWMEWSCKEFSDNIKVILGQNVTERIDLENTYEILVQNAEDFIYQVDVNGKFKFLNERFSDRLNYNTELLVGTISTNLVEDEHREMVHEFYKKQFRERKKISYLEFPIKTKNGSIIWLGQYVTALYQAGNDKIITGYLALGRDITERRAQDEIIQTQSIDIKSSINYAKRIQLNLLPNTDTFNEFFEESFIFFQPKAIVSGDFYWCKQVDHFTIIAVGDSTGHGVPGAFMSLLGINLLNSIIVEKQLINPGRVLDELDSRLRQLLSTNLNNSDVKDGMEITLCVFDNNSTSMKYACAGSKILVHDGNSFSLYKGDNKHIGDDRTAGFTNYVTHFTTIDQQSTVYLFTDGFQDQFGGRQNKKYSLRRLLELVENNIRLPLETQGKMVQEEFENWKATEEQTDDVTILAVRKKL